MQNYNMQTLYDHLQELFMSFLAYVQGFPFRVMMIPFDILTKVLLIRAPSWRAPPGPLANWLPFVGSLPLFAFRISYLMMTRIANKFGKIYRLKLGSDTYIVISDPKLIMEAFAKEELSGRNMPPLMDVMNHLGIIHAEGELLKSQRAFVNKIIIDMKDANHNMHKVFIDRISAAQKALIEELEATEGKPVLIEEALSFAVTNSFFSALVGTVFSRNDKELLSLISSTHDVFRQTKVFSIVNFIPALAKLPNHQNAFRTVHERKAAFTSYMQAIVEKHKLELNQENPRDLIDCFLIKMGKLDSDESGFFTEPQLYAVLGDIFSTSLETIFTTIQWLLLAIIKNSDLKKNLHDEFIRIIGHPGTQCLLEERSTMPILESTILEALRFSSILPIGVSHRALQETTLEGYTIPKDSTIMSLFWKIHRDTALWKNDPNTFEPSNHIDDRGLVTRSLNLLPFSTGQRACLGEYPALEVIALIFANLIGKFNMEAEHGAVLPSMDASRNGVLREPFPFKIRFMHYKV